MKRLQALLAVSLFTLTVASLLIGTWRISTASAAPDLNDGRVRVFVGRPISKPNAAPRRIYPSGSHPRGVTLVASRSSTPGAWFRWEYERIQFFAKRQKYLTWSRKPSGFDITPGVYGREYRVDSRLLGAINAVAKRRLSSCNVISGWRDSAKQAQLYLAFLAGVGNPANPPGTSKHEALIGMPARAADVYCGVSQQSFWAWTRHAGLEAYAKVTMRLRQPYGHEPWHVEWSTL